MCSLTSVFGALELLMSSARWAMFERLCVCVSNVSSSCYDLAAYAALFSVILEQSAAIGGQRDGGSGGGVRS